MPDITVCFEAHQPYRVNRAFSRKPGLSWPTLMDAYFDPRDREFLTRAVNRCYVPAGERILEQLDAGFSCAFSVSGILMEQLERWSPDTLSLFRQLAGHRRTELVASPRYHSISGLFPNLSDFEEEIREHRGTLRELAGRQPALCANTDLMFNNDIAGVLRRVGFRGAYAEGVSRSLGEAGPNHLFCCRDLPVLVRNARLSDDIALRFVDTGWDHYPLTADTFADWVADAPGEVVTLFLNYETFGEHHDRTTGILDFLSALPEALEKRGVETLLPSAALERYPPTLTLDMAETTTWADQEKNTSACLGNDYQWTACRAVRNALWYAGEKHHRGCLLSINHFYEMASAYGTCGERHDFLGHLNARDTFQAYMRILADYEDRSIARMRHRKAARLVRSLPPEKSFRFSSPAGDIGHVAYSLDQFLDLVQVVPDDSVNYHLGRGDFSLWARQMLEHTGLANRIRACTARDELVAVVRETRDKAWKLLR